MSSLFIKKLDILSIFEKNINLKTTYYIRDKIERLPKGYVFTYEDFITEVNKKEAVIKTLNRMASTSKIFKLSKGKFYKPEITAFGTLLPGQNQTVKDLLEKDGKIIGYLTGYSIYNQLGLTTQVSNTIQIGKNETRPSFKRDRYKISFIKQKNTINKENIPLLRILDAIKYVKKISDSSLEFSVNRLKVILNDLSNQSIDKMVKLALNYPPATRALLGALLDAVKKNKKSETLKKSLNPITKYKLSISDNILSTQENWNIK